MSHRLVWRIALIFIGFTVLVTMAGCSMTTPLGDDSSDDTGDIETDTPKEGGETATDSGATGTDSAGGESESASESTDNSTSETANEPGSNGAADQSTTTGPINDTGLPIDENGIYNLTRNLVGSDADAPAITIEELSYRVGQTDRPFFDYMGLTNESEEGSSGLLPAAVASGPDSVVVNEMVFDRHYGERTDRSALLLAHEFAHTIQMEEGWLESTRTALAGTVGLSTTESALLYRSLVEGGAVFTADEYADRTERNRSQMIRFEQQYGGVPAELVYAYGPYRHGGQYFRSVLDSAEELGSVYTDDIPASTEELLHPGYNDTEHSDVTFSAQTSRDDWTRQITGDDQLGAMFVHVVLTAHTELDAAAEASKGWANDQVFKFENESRSAFTWVTHWDSAADADQFAEAFNRTLPNRSDDDVGDVEVARAGNRSVVVLAGPEEFRDAIAIDGENADVDTILQSGAKDSVESMVPALVDTNVNRATGRG